MSIEDLNMAIKNKILEINYIKAKLAEKEFQINYLKNHVDIASLKPASGEFRENQMRLLEFTNKLLDDLKGINITPFLLFGNLLGAYRHKGFIPWDEDFDFGLMRADYEKLKNFCKKNFIVATYQKNTKKSELNYKKRYAEIKKLLKKYPNEYIFEECVDQIQIFYGTNLLDRLYVDFWSYDMFDVNYSFEEHLLYIRYIASKKNEIDNISSILEFLDQEIKNNRYSVNFVGNIYYGIDNVMPYIQTYRSEFFPYDVVFPFKKVPFENTSFFAPNNVSEFLKWDYKDVNSFSPDFGLNEHHSLLSKYINEFGLD